MRRSFAVFAACGLLGGSAVAAGSAATVLANSFFVQASAGPAPLADGTPLVPSGPVPPGKWFVEYLGPAKPGP